MVKQYFKFKPFSEKQLKVLCWWTDTSAMKDKDGIICDGAIRSGKTLVMSLSFILWAMTRYNEQNFAMCGKTIGSFRRNVLATLKLMLKSRGYKVTDRRADNLLVISKGPTTNYIYIFGGKDESSQDLIQGITLAGVFFDEVALMPRSFVEQATARCSVNGSKFWFNCNPDSPMHWFLKEWIEKEDEKNILHLHFTMDDNYSLTEEIKRRYYSQWSGVFYDRFIRGLWVKAEGLVYPMFDSDKHITSQMPESGRYYISTDYGTRNPFSAGLWCVFGGKAYRIKEYYYDGRENDQLTDEEHYAALEELAGEKNIVRLVIDPSAASMITCIKRHGKFRVKQADNAVIKGISYTASLLQAGKLLFSPECKDVIREFGLYSWDEKATEDKPIKEYDHALDDTRYFCSTILAREFKWQKWS